MTSTILSLCENFINDINILSEYREKAFVELHIKSQNLITCLRFNEINVYYKNNNFTGIYENLNDKNNLYIERINNNSTTLLQIGLENDFITKTCQNYNNKDGSLNFSNCTLEVWLSNLSKVNFNLILIKNTKINVTDSFIEQTNITPKDMIGIFPPVLNNNISFNECSSPECENFPKKGLNDYQFTVDIPLIPSSINLNFYKAILIVKNVKDGIDYGQDISKFFSTNNGTFIITMNVFPDIFDLYLIFNTQLDSSSTNSTNSIIYDESLNFNNNDKISIIKKSVVGFKTYYGQDDENKNNQMLTAVLGVISAFIVIVGVVIGVKLFIIAKKIKEDSKKYPLGVDENEKKESLTVEPKQEDGIIIKEKVIKGGYIKESEESKNSKPSKLSKQSRKSLEKKVMKTNPIKNHITGRKETKEKETKESLEIKGQAQVSQVGRI